MAESQAQAAQPQSSPQAPDQSPAAPFQADFGFDGGDADSGDAGVGGDDVANALQEVGYTPGHHNLESDEEAEGEGQGPKSGAQEGVESPHNPAEPKPPPAESDTVKPNQLATFHRQQREFQAQRQAFAAEKAEVDRIKATIDNAKVDRIAALEAMGYTDVKEFLTGLAEDNGRMTPERRELMEMKKWRDAQEAKEKTRQEEFQAQQRNAEIQAKVDQIRVNVQNRIRSPEMAERLINIETADEQVMREMDRLATETGVMPDIEVAIRNVEGHFQGALEQLAKNPAAIRFFQERLNSSKSGPAVTAQSKQRENTRTIGQDARSPGTHIPSENKSSRGDDVDVEDAVKWLRQVQRR